MSRRELSPTCILSLQAKTGKTACIDQLWYRNGTRCLGTRAYACPLNSQISLQSASSYVCWIKNELGFCYPMYRTPSSCDFCSTLRDCISTMFRLGIWPKLPLESPTDACSRATCRSVPILGSSLCKQQAMELIPENFGKMAGLTAIVHSAYKRSTENSITTPDDAAAFLEEPTQQFEIVTQQESEFLDLLRHGGPAFSTDTETIAGVGGGLLIQAAVINSTRQVEFSSYIHHNCKTIADIWKLAAEKSGGLLCQNAAESLRKAFGPPSQEIPRGNSVEWLAEKCSHLKQKYPNLMIQEWSMNGFDWRQYCSTFSKVNIQNVLPERSRWLDGIPNWQCSLPNLSGFSLGYVCCLFAPSDLVWSWHDAVADALMLYNITMSKCLKIH